MAPTGDARAKSAKKKWGKICPCIQYCVLNTCVSMILMMKIIGFLMCYLEFYMSLAFWGFVGGRGGDFPAKRLHLWLGGQCDCGNVVLTYLINGFICSYLVAFLCWAIWLVVLSKGISFLIISKAVVLMVLSKSISLLVSYEAVYWWFCVELFNWWLYLEVFNGWFCLEQ